MYDARVLRVVFAEDNYLVREGTVALLTEAGDVEIVGTAASFDGDGPVGQGLVGMRERVALCGGDLQAGPRQSGGFRVRATIPKDREAA